MTRTHLALCLLVAASTLHTVAQAATKSMTCGQGKTISGEVEKLSPGDTLLVSGVCNENVVIRSRTSDIVIDGQNAAIIEAASSTQPAVLIRGRGIQITGFPRIAGGRDGVLVLDGASAFVFDNTIDANTGFGIQVSSTSTARIWNNVVSNNASGGILVNHASNAFIGFPSYGAPPQGNTIRDNPGGAGIQVTASSSAVIVGNTITRSGFEGIHVNRGSQAETASNAVERNGTVGIRITLNSVVSLGRDVGTGPYEMPNSTGPANGEVGFSCSSGGAHFGRLGTLNGLSGAFSISPSCVGTLM